MTAIEAFDYLSGLLTGYQPLVVAWKSMFLHVEKRADMDDVIMVALKTTANAFRTKEYYIVERNGVTGMHFEYPPFFQVPPCPIDFPAYMTDDQRDEWNRIKAEKVVEFVKEALVATHGGL